MGYFVIIVFTTFLGSPPEFLPIAFKNQSDCESYLTQSVKNKFVQMRLEFNNELRYLVNDTNNKFIVCNKLEYPILNSNIVKTRDK